MVSDSELASLKEKLNIEENTEDELSILKNELYKITIMLKEVAENSQKDKTTLKDSLSDISHQLKTPLTSITIILAIPTLVASLWGMNVPVPLQNYQYGFPVLLAVSFVVTLTVMVWLKKRNMLN